MQNPFHSRRQFLKNSSLVLGATGLGWNRSSQNSMNAGEEPSSIRIKEYRMLGRTGFQVSDIGSGAPENENLLKAMLNSGINFIDTSEVYENGNNEILIGRTMKNFDRKKVFIATKVYSETGFSGKEDVLNRVRKSLERLDMEYVDCVMIHSAENTRIISDTGFHEAIVQLKQEGRVKHAGVSCHGSSWLMEPEESIDKILLKAAEDGRFDLFLMTYNFLNASQVEPVLALCEKKGIGTAIMKSNPVKQYFQLKKIIDDRIAKGTPVREELQKYFDRSKQNAEKVKSMIDSKGEMSDEELKVAAYRFVLNDPRAHTLCMSFDTLEEFEKYSALSGSRLELPQALLLEDYKEHFGFLNCRIGCNLCEKHCPHQLEVNNLLRFHYYFEKKRKEKQAMVMYNTRIKKRNLPCTQCKGYCEAACPFRVAVKTLLAQAHGNLSFPLG